jgi:dTDP-4-dehydrorhamnose reductase
MQHILVTGSYGQLGCEIRKISNQLSGYSFHFHDVDTLDITNPGSLEKFFNSHPIDYIVNCAGYTNVDQAEKEVQSAFEINGTGPANLAHQARLHSAKLIHISTDYVFDGSKRGPYTEDDMPNPQSVYGKSKMDGEKKVMREGENMIIRTSWLYSAYGNNFVKKMMQLTLERPSVRVVDDQVGSPTFAGDLAKGILSIIQRVSDNESIYQPGIYHYGNEGSCSWYNIAQAIVRFTGVQCEVIPIKTEEYPLPAKRPANSVLSTAKIRSQFNLSIPQWEESLSICMQIIQKQ